MINPKCNLKRTISLLILLSALFSMLIVPRISRADDAKPIIISQQEEPIEDRMQRAITLDVRDMNVVDVIKFLALKGEFNIVVSPTVEGRATVLLNSVNIKDALDIVIISNRLAYKIQSNIVQVMTAAEYEAMYGKSFSDKTKVEIIHLKYSKPSYVLAALENMKSNVGKIIIDEDTGSVVLLDTPESIERMKTSLNEMEQPLETFVYTLQYAKADVVAEKMRARLDAKAVGSISADERSNQLIVRAYHDRRKELESILVKLDTPTKEVLVDARILEIVLKPKYDMGVDWQYSFRNSTVDAIKKLAFKNVYLNQSGLSTSDNVGTQYGQVAVGDINVDEFQFSLRALKEVSDTRILANPQILVTNNDEAKIHIGDTVPYIISTTSGTGDNAITSEDVRFVDVGLKLNVSPTINDDGFVTMRLAPEISTVVGTISSKGGGIPQVNKTEVETTVMVKDGNTIIMGGLKRDDKFHTKKGYPGLMEIPIIGKLLFSRQADSITKTELVILITPHIISGKEDYVQMKSNIKPFKSYSTDQ